MSESYFVDFGDNEIHAPPFWRQNTIREALVDFSHVAVKATYADGSTALRAFPIEKFDNKFMDEPLINRVFTGNALRVEIVGLLKL